MINTPLLMIIGAVVLAVGCFAVLRIRRHSVMEAASMSAGVLGMVVVLALIKWFLF